MRQKYIITVYPISQLPTSHYHSYVLLMFQICSFATASQLLLVVLQLKLIMCNTSLEQLSFEKMNILIDRERFILCQK